MILNPAIIALNFGSLLLSIFAVYASYFGLKIIRHWDIASGSDLQLSLERKTYLISTVLTYLMAFELLSFFLFVYTADSLHEMFVGAMCAAGALNVDSCGYLTLLVKILNVVLCGLWLVLNHVDSRGYDYPLIRPKYKLLLAVSALLLLETYLQWTYFGALNADVITSCCGALFSQDNPSIAGDLATISPGVGKILLFVSLYFILRIGLQLFFTGSGAVWFAGASSWFFVFSAVALISFISVYYYELPTHHCPFCLLQLEYHHIGYVFYISTLAGGILGLSVGTLNRYRDILSLKRIIPPAQKKLCMGSMISYSIFAATAGYPMIFSDFKLAG
ncbi:MAG: hypothetical protein AB1512_20775 [Thermodesulfobacteriota bacterium]